MVSMGDFSKELCGGTHVANTGNIMLFKIVSESGIAAGVRRIEALTGNGVLEYYKKQEELLHEAAKALKANPAEIVEKIGHLQGEVKASYAKELMHGKKKLMYKTGESRLFKDLPDTFAAARYHSLAALKDTLPAELKVTAESEDGEVMAVEHTKYPVFGVQFHPESVMTPDGRVMIENFMEVVRND